MVDYNCLICCYYNHNCNKKLFNKERNTTENVMQLNGNFSNGVYFIQLLDTNGNIVATKKAINN